MGANRTVTIKSFVRRDVPAHLDVLKMVLSSDMSAPSYARYPHASDDGQLTTNQALHFTFCGKRDSEKVDFIRYYFW
jgi:hypothetical protein